MTQLASLLLAFAPIGLAVPFGLLPKRSCTGGYRHGSQVDLGEFWYYCNNGHLENRGCFAQNRQRITINQKYVADGLLTRCVVTYGGDMRLEYAGCVVDDEVHGPNQFWNDHRTNLWYFCEQLGSTLRLNFGGCVMDGDRIAKGRFVVQENVIYKCFESHADQQPGLRPVGCMHYAKRYNLGNTFDDGGYYYNCLESNGTAIKQAVGCVQDGERLNPGDRYIEGDVIYECEIEPEGSRVAVGCVRQLGLQEQSRDYRLVGERWTQGHAPYRYQVECVRKDTEAVIESVACVYVDSKGHEVSVPVGCVKLVDKYAIACRRREKDGLIEFAILESMYADHVHHFGVKFCAPKSA